jgi:two-component system LytT family sensor kinase
MTIEFCYLIFITINYYTIDGIIIPRLLLKKKYLLFVISIVFIIIVSAWLRTLLSLYMNAYVFQTLHPADFRTTFINSILNIALWVSFIMIAKMLIDKMESERLVESLEKERVKNELNYLKAQINPHALFNSLNTIYGQIDKSNQNARNVLLQFSELLRYQLYDCSAEKVSLEREISYLKNYVDFQCLRKNETLKVLFHVDINQNGLTIAPLLLIVLIENAFKFVSNFSDKENKIEIDLVCKNSVLSCSFVNTKDGDYQPQKNAKGIGIANLTRRLTLLYADKYELKVCNEDYRYTINLNIDLS